MPSGRPILIAFCIIAVMLALAPQESQAGLLGRLFGGRRAVGSCANGQCGRVEKSQVAGPSRCYVDSKGNKVCPVK